MFDPTMIELWRWQFAAYHFIFVPLTLGMVWMLVIMESVYVMTGKESYRDMTKFWGSLFGINFALGVLTSTDIIISLSGFIAFYTLLLIIGMYLMFKFGRLRPSSLHTGRYHFET